MLLKWLFTLLAIIWLYQAIQPFFVTKSTTKQTPRPKDKTKIRQRDDDNDGDYIDYEEIK